MHYYDNGTALKIKRDNWKQLILFFKKNEIPYDNGELDRIMECTSGAIVPYINWLYSYLTDRKLQEAPTRDYSYLTTDEGPYNRASPSRFPRLGTGRASEPGTKAGSVAESKMDETGIPDNLTHADMFSVTSEGGSPTAHGPRGATSPKILRGPTRTVGAEEKEARIKVNKVQVKTIEKSISQLRAAKDPSKASLGFKGNSSRPGTPHMSSVESLLSGGKKDITPVSEILSQVINDVLEEHGAMDIFGSSKDAVTSFITSIKLSYVEGVESNLSQELSLKVFQGITSSIPQLVSVMLKSDKQFWSFLSIFTPLMVDAPEDSPSFTQVTDLIMQVGDACIELHADVTFQRLKNMGIIKFIKMLKRLPNKRHAILRTLYAFTPSDNASHVSLIRILKDEIDDLGVFIHCLTMCIFMEPELTTQLLDLYVYYCIIGLGMPSPNLRAGCLTMISVIVTVDVNLVVEPNGEILAHLKSLVSDTWWEIHAQLLVVSAAVLSELPVGSSLAVPIYEIVEECLTPASSVNIKNLGLSYLAKTVSTHPRLADCLSRVLMSMNADTQRLILEPQEAPISLPIVGSSGAKYYLAHLPSEWNGVVIAQALAGEIKAAVLENLEVEHLNVLLACMSPSLANVSAFTDDNQENWYSVFSDLQNYIYVALCDPTCTDLSANILRTLIFESNFGLEILDNKRLIGCLQLLFPSNATAGNNHCQEVFGAFYEDLFHMSLENDAFAEVVPRLILDFGAKFSDRVDMFPVLSNLVSMVESSTSGGK